jgi:ketosteroid isomerase-like protein
MSSAAQKVQESNDEMAIRAVIESVAKAHYDKNAAGVVAPYAKDAVIYELAPPLSHMGMDVKQKQAWMDGWEGAIEREVRDLEITVTGDFAMVHGYYRLGGTPKSAGRPISFWMRATVALRREGNSWQIVHEHTSVPLYMDGSLRPAFDLEP